MAQGQGQGKGKGKSMYNFSFVQTTINVGEFLEVDITPTAEEGDSLWAYLSARNSNGDQVFAQYQRMQPGVERVRFYTSYTPSWTACGGNLTGTIQVRRQRRGQYKNVGKPSSEFIIKDSAC